MSDDNPTIIEPIEEQQTDTQWTPIIGPETVDFMQNSVPVESQESIQNSAASILSRGTPPTRDSGQETGIVVGYVQSGKTMSFETVAALARDNNFQIVIIVAGVSNNLLVQSTSRLHRDFRLAEPGRARRWLQFCNPDPDDTTQQAIRNVLDDWADPSTPEGYKRTVLITVLKHHQRLLKLSDLMGSLELVGVPVLVIDDEADQAGLNTDVGQGQESTTYRRFMELRSQIPHHTYLQYTATPQAPLLINIIDSLSPNFVEILVPGEQYVGGKEFFSGNTPYVKLIPSLEVPTNANPLSEPPESLLDALRIFMIGVASGLHADGNKGNRSMLVHPSHLTVQHQEYYNWVCDIFNEWQRILNLPDNDLDKQELLEDLRNAHEDLRRTVGGALPPFNDISSKLKFAFRHTRILEINARAGKKTPEVDWLSAYGLILVGGMAMDRGFTIEGLTVTYMPRGIGVGNADTIQQRARFFGYKRRYLGFCRVYLEQGTFYAFQSYVDHEEDIRAQLLELQDRGLTLNDWKRAFVLDSALRPCRQSVLEFDYMQGRFADKWVSPGVVYTGEEVASANRDVVDAFIQLLKLVENSGHADRTNIQRHHVCDDVPLSNVLELLIPIRITGTSDSQRHTGMLLQLSKALEDNPNERCSVYLMSPSERRQRGIDDNGQVTNIFQGEAPVNPPEQRGSIYPGDRAIRKRENVTIQIHRLDLTRNKSVVASDVPVVAVWIPRRLERCWVVQEQG